jgi:peptidoglycan/LPS O-acetylase OafA/YrhL
MNERFHQLDSVRGLAALTVVVHHLFLTIPTVSIIEKLKYTPLHIFWAGHESVILFFILSGFVLSLSFHNNKAQKYKDYLIRRICRIYIPYIVSVLLAVVLMVLLSHGPIPELGREFNQSWNAPVSLRSLLGHVLMLGQFSSTLYNSAIWSLVHEMRISIIFPLVMLLVLRFGWRRNLLIGFVCSGIYFAIWYAGIKHFRLNVVQTETSFMLTLHYIGFFILGALLAKYRIALHEYYRRLSTSLKMALAFVAILSYTYTWWFLPHTSISGYLHYTFIDDWVIGFGSAIFIVFAINSRLAGRLLQLKAIKFIGRISYSLYLFHMSVLLSLFQLLHDKVGNGVLCVAVFFLSILLAAIMYYLVELPSGILGKVLTQKKIFFNNNKVEEMNKQYV